MKIQAVVRGSHHEGLPLFNIDSNNFNDADLQFKNGVNDLKSKNDMYIKNHEGYFATLCPIIDFKFECNNIVKYGQMGFDLNGHISIERLINWYIDNKYEDYSSWYKERT